ncbi:proton-coupled folate transporter-like [Penaeus japonicus]|uniref:proton-coupled folate transporter-like n=1 Tax=Penaeus japonicus TaxID=27405 RepID=UPI001C71562F|nr:proton-coupled folate transporter-like [Penaeus japonicus]
MMLLMAAYSFMADKTNAKSRTFRMTIMNSIMHLGGPLGTSLGAWVFAARGYAWVFGLSLLISVTCLVLVIFIVGDKSPESDASGGKEAPRSPWNPRNVVDLFRACFRRRPGRGRVHLILLMLIMLGQISSTPHNLYLWTRRVYLWDENQYSLYLTINQVMEQVSSLVTAPLLHKMAAHDCSMGAGASFFLFLKLLSLGLTTNPSQWWVLYIFVIIPFSIPSAAIRGLMSKICDADEVGKVFSMLAILEVLWPLADSALFTAVYSTTLEFYPSYEHLVGAFFGAFLFCGFLGLRFSLEQVKNRVDKDPTEEKPPKVEDPVKSC